MTKRFFVKIVTDPEVDLRKCIVGIACAAQAVNDGYDVDMFFAANGVKMLHSEFVAGVNNSGMLPDGLLDELLNTITSGAKKVYCSTGSSCKWRHERQCRFKTSRRLRRLDDLEWSPRSNCFEC